MRRRGARPRTGTFPKKAMITDARRSRLATTPLERVRAHADYTEARCQQRVAILGHTLQIARTRRLRPLERLELQERLDAATAALINARRHKSWVSSHPDEAVAHGVEDGAIDDAFAELKEEFADFELVDWGWVARAFSDQLGGVVSHNLKAAFEAEAARRAVHGLEEVRARHHAHMGRYGTAVEEVGGLMDVAEKLADMARGLLETTVSRIAEERAGWVNSPTWREQDAGRADEHVPSTPPRAAVDESASPRAPPAPTRRSRFAARRPRSTPIAAASAASAASAAQTRRAEDIDNLVEDHWNAAKTGSSPPSCLACFEPFASAGEMVPLLMCAQGHRICKGCSIKLMKFDATGCPVCKAPLPDTLILDWGLMDSLRTSENAFTARAPP